MELTPYKKENLANVKHYKKSDVLILLEEFAESDLDCVKIENWKYSSPYSCMSSFRNAALRYKMTNIRCVVRDKEVFLVKEI